MSISNVSAVEIDKKLRDDFRRRLKDYGISADITDPVLAVLFRTFAQQLETLYSDTERIRVALLDELIEGLGLDGRTAKAAQTVMRFAVDSGSELIAAGTELSATSASGETYTFVTDASFYASAARIAFAATYQDGLLQLMAGVDLPEAMQMVRPSTDPVKANLGPTAAIFLALENLPATSLSMHAFFLEIGPDAKQVEEALQTQPWCLAKSDGSMSGAGMLRPRRANAGVNKLTWLAEPGASGESEPQDTALPTLRDGFYGNRVFILPLITEPSAFMCRVPRGMEPALGKIFGHEAHRLVGTERAWLRISLPGNVPPLRTAIESIVPHAMTASNVYCFNQTLYFDKHGTSVPISHEAGTKDFLAAPLSVLGESGSPYAPAMQTSSQQNGGRYLIHNGRIELHPASRPDGRRESYVNVRVWLTAGARGNSVGPGATGVTRKNGNGIRATNVTAAAGGSDKEEFASARDRFYEALLSRDRIVTRNDLIGIVRAFDPRIQDADVSLELVRTRTGMRRLDHVTVVVAANDFADPDIELPVLEGDLVSHLQARSQYGTELRVQVQRR